MPRYAPRPWGGRGEDRRLREGDAGGDGPCAELFRHAPARPERRLDAQSLRYPRARGGPAREGEDGGRRGRRRAHGPSPGGRLSPQGARDRRRPRRARLRRRARRLRPGGDGARARQGARARGSRARPFRPAGERLGRRRPLVGRRRAAAAARRLPGRQPRARRGQGEGEPPDGVRLRRDRGAAPVCRRGLGRDQRAALPLPEGDHGREEEAPGDREPRGSRPFRRRCRRGRLPHRGARALGAALARREPEDRGRRRQRSGPDRLVPVGEEAALVSTLVYVEDHEGELSQGSLGVLSHVAALGDEVAAVLCGSGVKELAGKTGRYGAARALVADDPALEHPLPQPRVDVLAKLIGGHGFDTVVFASSVLTADVAAGLAARLGAGLNWDLVGLEDFSQKAVMLGRAHAESEGPSIEEADVIVAGGRGLGEPKNFGLLEELAKALGGAVAATRAVVDAGWYPYAAQVGQTGKTVSPKLYVACGISGAIQHKVGMQSAGTIVAINKDPNAPIFEYSDLGVVGDLHEIVPKLTQLLKERKAS